MADYQVGPGNKRRRTDGARTMDPRARKAMAINAKINSAYPYATYGRAYLRRGTPENVARWGETFRSASAEQKKMRKDFGYVGKGLYSGRGKYGVRKFARDVNRLGRLIPKSVRQQLTDSAVAGIQAGTQAGLMYGGQGLYSGRGGYNGLIAGGPSAMSISGGNDETQSLTITHREFLQDIFGPANAGFNIEGWNLNPSLIDNFPWLSQMAMNYEEYEFIQLVFEFRSTVDATAINNSAGNTGTIMMATNYNPTAPLFTGKEQMMQYHGCQSGRLVEDHHHGVECDPAKNAGAPQKYTRTTTVQIGQDLKTFDLGTFQLAQTNVPSQFFNQQVGELFVYYTVKLDKPRMFSNLGAGIVENRYVSCGGETFSNLLGTNRLSMQQNYLPLGITQTTNNIKITFPDFLTGVFDIQLSIEGGTAMPGGIALTGFLIGALPTVTGNVSLFYDMYGGDVVTSDAPSYTTFALSGSHGVAVVRVKVEPVTAGIDNTITITTSLSAGTVNQSQLIVRQTNPALFTSSSVAVPVYINSVGVVTSPVIQP